MYILLFFQRIVDTEDALVEVKCLFSASKLELTTNTIAEITEKLKEKFVLKLKMVK